MPIRFLFFTIFSLFALAAFAQHDLGQNYLPVAHHFGVEEGLPHRQVNCILQDRQGFIWVATNGGVARYDGVRFKIFNKADNGLTTNLVDWLLEDGAGNLWLISKLGYDRFTGISSVDILNPVSGRVIPLSQYRMGGLPVPLRQIHSQGIRLDGSRFKKPGTLLFGTRDSGGWVTWHPETGWERVVVPSVPDLIVASVTPQGGILGGSFGTTHSVLIETDAKGGVLHSFEPDAGKQFGLMYGGARSRQAVFVIEYDEVYKREPVFWEFRPGTGKTPLGFTDKHRSIWNQQVLVELQNGNVWLTETKVLDKSGKVLLDLLAQFPYFNNRYVDNLLVDRSGGIWLGTVFGLELIEIRKDLFRRFLFNENAINGAGTACRGLFQKDSVLWVNTEGRIGLHGINLQTSKLIFKQKENWNYGLSFDNAGNLWSDQHPFPELKTVLSRVDPYSGKTLDSVPFQSNIPIWIIFPQSPKRLWLGTQQGLLFFDTKTKQLSKPDFPFFPELQKATIIHIAPSRSGAVWLCTTTGFYKMTAAGHVLKRYWSGGTAGTQFPFNDFYHFYEDRDGIFWLATAGAGLLRWNPATGEQRLFSRKDGLLNGHVYAVYEDRFGHLWLPTDYGIAQFDKKALTVRRTWLSADGLAQNEFNRTSHFQGADGTLYFGGLNGVTAFHPKNFYEATGKDNSDSKKLVVSDFKRFSDATGKLENETAALLASVKKEGGAKETDGEIVIPPSGRYIQLEFALLDYFAPKKVSYSYRINGVEDEWITLSEPQLRLSTLPYGTHRLKIRAHAADGTWAQNELQFQLKVLRPFYLRWWFLLLGTFALLAGGFYFYRFLLRRRIAEKETLRLQQLDAFKTRFFTNISHEFRTPLTVILGMVEHLKKQFDTGAEKEHEQTATLIRRNGQQLLTLVNQLLDLSRLEAGKLQLSATNGDLPAFLLYQVESFQSYAQSRNILLSFDSAWSHLNASFDPQKIHTIAVNLIANALKFTPPGGSIRVELHSGSPEPLLPPKQFVLAVSDTGIGIPEAELGRIFDRFYQVDDSATRKGDGTGIGLALTQELVKLMKGTITVESKPGSGTRFQIVLPFTPPRPDEPLADAPQQYDESGFVVPVAGTSPIMEEADTRPLLLIVEDNPDVRFYISECVKASYRVALAANGRQGLEKARELVPDLLISDVMMPEMDGLTLCETVKNDEITSHIPVVLLTARADFESRISGLRRGADVYLAKPFEPAELMAHLHNLENLRRRLQKRYAAMQPLPVAENPDPAVEMEDAFLQKIREVVNANLSKWDFDVPELARALTLSRSQLFRKVKALTGSSPSVAIRTIRLQKAKELLQNRELSVSEVAYEVGFSSATYFSSAFSELFGQSPTDWRQS